MFINRATSHPYLVSGPKFCIVYQIDGLGTFGNEVLRVCIDQTRDNQCMPIQAKGTVFNLIIALCAPDRYVTSWQKDVRAVSGEETLEEVMFDLTLISRSPSASEVTSDGRGPVGKLLWTGALGW